jgi:hypothetical protein
MLPFFNHFQRLSGNSRTTGATGIKSPFSVSWLWFSLSA